MVEITSKKSSDKGNEARKFHQEEDWPKTQTY